LGISEFLGIIFDEKFVQKPKLMRYIKSLFCALIVFGTVQAQDAKELVLQLSHNYGAETFSLNQIYSTDEGVDIRFSRFEYYLNINSINFNAGESLELDDKYLLVNTEDIQYSLGAYAVSNIDSLLFHIGVQPDFNHEDPALWSNDHPLAPQSPSMHWGWIAGYRFMAIEGMLDTDNNGVMETILQYHPVDDKYYTPVVLLANTVEEEDKITIYVDVNYDKMFEAIGVSNGGVFHGDYLANDLLLANIEGNSVFTASTNLTVEESVLVNSLYPNPCKEAFQIELNEDAQLSIYDIQGRSLRHLSLESGSQVISTRNLNRGVYMLMVETKTSRQSFKILKN